ncbi:MAG: cobalt ECF transporter T component CbiQ [Thermoleophilia bacterium]
MADARLNMPDWMRESSGEVCRRNGRTLKKSAVEKTIRGIAAALRTSIYSERIAERDGLLQGIDPRAKLAGMLLLLVAAAVVRNPVLLVLLYLLLLAAAMASSVPAVFFIKRVWLFIPVFAGIIVLPSIFSVVRPGDPLLVLWDFGREVDLGPWSLGTALAITRQGLEGAALLVMRVAVSVSLAVLVSLTTRWSELLQALRSFRVPAVFVLILSMTYRYIYLLLGLAAAMYEARASRLSGGAGPREDRRFAAASAGSLLGKSYALSADVYAAMVSRGYRGEPRSRRRFRLSPADLLATFAAASVAALMIGGDRFLA